MNSPFRLHTVVAALGLAGTMIFSVAPAQNIKIANLSLTDNDKADLAAILSQSTTPKGDTFDLERDRSGPHGSIMKYNLNTAS